MLFPFRLSPPALGTTCGLRIPLFYIIRRAISHATYVHWPMWTIFLQLLSFIYSSIVSWWWANDIAWASLATSSKPDHKVSIISPSTWVAPSTKLRVNFRKHDGICAARCHFPTTPMISSESDIFSHSNVETHLQKCVIHWQHISYIISAWLWLENCYSTWQIE